MTDPLDKAGAKAPPIIGSGCSRRYDPEHMGPELGTGFPGAEELWRRYLSQRERGVNDSFDESAAGSFDGGSDDS